MPIKQKSLSLPRNLPVANIGKLLVVFSNFLYLDYFIVLKCSLLQLIKQKCLLDFLRPCMLMTQAFLYLQFLLELTWNCTDILVTAYLVKMIISSLDSAKASGPDCTPVAILNNCERERSYILVDLFNMYLKESCFPDCWKVLSAAPAFKMFGRDIPPKVITLFSLFDRKFLEKLVPWNLWSQSKMKLFFLIYSMVSELLVQL